MDHTSKCMHLIHALRKPCKHTITIYLNEQQTRCTKQVDLISLSISFCKPVVCILHILLCVPTIISPVSHEIDVCGAWTKQVLSWTCCRWYSPHAQGRTNGQCHMHLCPSDNISTAQAQSLLASQSQHCHTASQCWYSSHTWVNNRKPWHTNKMLPHHWVFVTRFVRHTIDKHHQVPGSHRGTKFTSRALVSWGHWHRLYSPASLTRSSQANGRCLLCRLCNQIPSSMHSSVVQRHLEFQGCCRYIEYLMVFSTSS